MPIRVKIMLVALVGVMIVGSVLALRYGVSGDDEASLAKPTGVERFIPESGTHNPEQQTVGIDLADGYQAYLIVEGVRIDNITEDPNVDGLHFTPGLQIYEYRPGPGLRVTHLSTPKACVTAMVWRAAEGRDSAKPAAWCFFTT